MTGKQARWRRFALLEHRDFITALGHGADAHRIDPRRFASFPPSCQLQRLAA